MTFSDLYYANNDWEKTTVLKIDAHKTRRFL